jgi:hypothetical protein
MERLDWTTKENHKAAVLLVKDAYDKLGGDRTAIEALLPEPLIMRLQVHETGCQLTLLLSDDKDEHPIIVAWTGSVWYNSGYEFNDRNKIFGLAPDVPFAAGAITDFFNAVADLLEGKEKADADAAATQATTEVETREQALAYYASQFPATVDQVAPGPIPVPAPTPGIRITEAAPEGNEETSG